MNLSLDVALIGMKAALDQMERTGEQFAQLAGSSSDTAKDEVELISQQHSFEASATVARAADETLGSLLDLFT